MAIENRELPVGTRLVATHKKEEHICRVEQGEGGKKAYVLTDGRSFTSPSAAGSAVMGGTACNGWRFWTLEGDEPKADARPERSKAEKRGPNGKKPSRMIKRVANQRGVPDGQVRWFCDACMKSFIGDAQPEPEVCPEGHRLDDPQFA